MSCNGSLEPSASCALIRARASSRLLATLLTRPLKSAEGGTRDNILTRSLPLKDNRKTLFIFPTTPVWLHVGHVRDVTAGESCGGATPGAAAALGPDNAGSLSAKNRFHGRLDRPTRSPDPSDPLKYNIYCVSIYPKFIKHAVKSEQTGSNEIIREYLRFFSNIFSLISWYSWKQAAETSTFFGTQLCGLWRNCMNYSIPGDKQFSKIVMFFQQSLNFWIKVSFVW